MGLIIAVAVAARDSKSVVLLVQDFLPASQQSAQNFDEHFSKVGLEVLVKYRRAQESAEKRRTLKTELEELIENEATSEEVIDRCQQHMETAQLSDIDVTVLVSAYGPPNTHDLFSTAVFCAAVALHYGKCRVE